MGLFDFVKSAGAKIFGKDKEEEARKRLEAEAKEAHQTAVRERIAEDYVRDLGLKVDNFNVKMQDERAMVYGEAADQSTRERIVLALGNLEGVSQVEDNMTAKQVADQAQFYTVQPGDSLSKIAKQHYGDPMKYHAIFEANKPMLSDPNKIYPGQTLRIPAQA